MPPQITLFSTAVGKRTDPVGRPPVPSPGTNSADSTKLMFWVLGIIACVMVVVMAILVAMCFLRQRREKKRSRGAVDELEQGFLNFFYMRPLRSTRQSEERPRLGADFCTGGIGKIKKIVTFLFLESEPSLRSLCGLYWSIDTLLLHKEF